MKPYRFDPAALAEYDAAAGWYAEHSDRAADFVQAVENAIGKIRRTPRAFQRWPGLLDHEVRRTVVARFPYLVIYRFDREGVLIVAVAHGRRPPGYWLERVRP